MSSQLLHAEGNALLIIIKVEDNNVELLVEFNQLFWVADSAPRHVGDVHQTVDATEVDEHTVRSDVLDRSFENLSFLQAADDHALLLFEFCFDERFV